MNSKIRKINPESLLFFDIETARRNKELQIDTKEFDLYAWSIRNKETSEIPEAKEVIAHYEKNGALKPEFNRIVCISVGYIKGDTMYYKALVGEQKDIIEEFYGILSTSGLTPCGHNIIAFDAPTTRLKAFECGVDLSILSDKQNDVGNKPWTISDNLLDTMELSKGTYYYGISLDAMCMLAGIDTPKDDISGVDVSRVYYEEGVERIAAYCNKDIIATAQLFMALQGKKGYIKNFVNRDEVVVDDRPVLHKLFSAGNFSAQLQDEVKALIGKKRLTKADKVNLRTILRGVMVQTDFVNNNQDTKAVIAEKEAEIDEFINTL